MKIALLNLPVDNNYGGNLQRYALMKVLQDMGHDVTHIFLKWHDSLPWYKYPYSYTKRIIKKYILRKPTHIREERYRNIEYEKSLDAILPFYNKYIKHTEPCYNIKDIIKVSKGKFDAYVVGSDQVWRKGMCSLIGWRNYLLEFTKGEYVKRIAYAASFGKDSAEYERREYEKFTQLVRIFDSVSVRESSAITILNSMGCDTEKFSLCLDPTLLLSSQEWRMLCKDIDSSVSTKGKIFCYVLDMTDEIDFLIKKKSEELNIGIVIAGLSQPSLSISEWLLAICNANFIITDSYHGTVFSIIFEKPFYFCGNTRRGNSRVESLMGTLGCNKIFDKEIANNNISKYRMQSLNYLKGIK